MCPNLKKPQNKHCGIVLDSVAICLQSQVNGDPVSLPAQQPLRFPSLTRWLLRLSENWDSSDLKAWFALKEYRFKFFPVEEQTAQITQVPLVGVASLTLLHSPGDPFICEPVAPAEG